MTCKELDRYIARFVQKAVKREGKRPYPPNCVATAISTEALSVACSVVHVHMHFPVMYAYGYHESALLKNDT